MCGSKFGKRLEEEKRAIVQGKLFTMATYLRKPLERFWDDPVDVPPNTKVMVWEEGQPIWRVAMPWSQIVAICCGLDSEAYGEQIVSEEDDHQRLSPGWSFKRVQETFLRSDTARLGLEFVEGEPDLYEQDEQSEQTGQPVEEDQFKRFDRQQRRKYDYNNEWNKHKPGQKRIAVHPSQLTNRGIGELLAKALLPGSESLRRYSEPEWD